MQNIISLDEQKKAAEESEEALLKAIEVDLSYPEPYAYMSVLLMSVKARLWTERSSRFKQEADVYQQRFQEARKRQAERARVEQELRGIR